MLGCRKGESCAALFVESFLDSSDPVALGDLLPLGHGLPSGTRVVSAHIAALRTREELLWRREEGKTRVVHGLPQTQRVIRNLQRNRRMCV